MHDATKKQYKLIVTRLRDAAQSLIPDLEARRIEPGRLQALRYRVAEDDYGPCCVSGHLLSRAFKLPRRGATYSVGSLFKELLKDNGCIHSGVTASAAWGLVREMFQPLIRANDNTVWCRNASEVATEVVSRPERFEILAVYCRHFVDDCDTLIQKTIPVLQDL